LVLVGVVVACVIRFRTLGIGLTKELIFVLSFFVDVDEDDFDAVDGVVDLLVVDVVEGGGAVLFTKAFNVCLGSAGISGKAF